MSVFREPVLDASLIHPQRSAAKPLRESMADSLFRYSGARRLASPSSIRAIAPRGH
jgi:hypothetical protein